MDMANALQIWFRLNLDRLGLLPEALEIVETAEDAFPTAGSPKP